jgi:hypothetical protein
VSINKKRYSEKKSKNEAHEEKEEILSLGDSLRASHVWHGENFPAVFLLFNGKHKIKNNFLFSN